MSKKQIYNMGGTLTPADELLLTRCAHQSQYKRWLKKFGQVVYIMRMLREHKGSPFSLLDDYTLKNIASSAYPAPKKDYAI